MLFGRFDKSKVGLTRNREKLEIRIDGEIIKRRSDLVRRSPINIVNADSFVLIDGAPSRRRSYLDWCLFHVEPEYAVAWRSFHHALAQRNRLLKNRRDLNLLDYWDRHLVELSVWLFEKRAGYSKKLQTCIDGELQEILGGLPLSLEYRKGWSGDDFASSLADCRERDIRAGYTSVGIHRDDLEITSSGNKVGEVLSRGQGKRVCMALMIAVLKMVEESSDFPVILLIDDLHSELDQHAQRQVYRQLAKMDLQLFVSNISRVLPASMEAKEFKLFHVEHGTIKPQVFS